MSREKEVANARIVFWGKEYATGIELIDRQHYELVNLTNELYRSCLGSGPAIEVAFKEAMSRMVEYVRFHFTAEQKLLQRINYPDHHNHKRAHDALVQNILKAAQDYNEGKRLVPNHFVRMLADWVFEHIAKTDKYYAAYVAEQREKGLMNEQLLLDTHGS